MANLQNTESPISRAERNKLNGNWEAILENFRHLQRQINILAGTDVEALIKTITDTIDHANQTVMDLIDETTEVTDQKVAEVNAALDNLSTLLTKALQQMETARIEANNAAANANDKANQAQTAADDANTATANANTATQNTNEAISNAEVATNQANTARDDATSAASLANDAAASANTAKDDAITATNEAVEATENVIVATSLANEVIGSTIRATEEANSARDEALQAAQSVINAIETMQADIHATKDAFAHKGEYSASVQYYKDNEVSFDKSTYRAKKDTLGNAPTPLVDNEYWLVVARRGVDGSGAVHSINNQVGDVVLEPSTIGAASETDLLNLSGTVVEVDDRLTKQLEQTMNKTDGVISIEDETFGAKGDGSDSSNAINAALLYASENNYSVYIPYGKVFTINSPIIWDAKTIVYGGGIIKAESEMPHVVLVDKDNTNITENGRYKTGRWLNVSIDANHLAQFGFYVRRGKGGEFAYASVLNATVSNIQLGDIDTINGQNAWEWNVHDIYTSGGRDDERPDYCIRLSSKFMDSTLQNLIVANAKVTHIYNQSGTIRWQNIHTYSYPTTQMVEVMFYSSGQGCHFDQLYLDTPGKTALQIANSGQRVKGIYLLVPDLLDATTSKPLIKINSNANATVIEDVITNIPISMAADKKNLIILFEIDNSNNNIYDISVGTVMNMGAVPKEDVKILGKVPYRFNHANYMGGAQTRYSFNQELFNRVVYMSEKFTRFTFKNELQDNLYHVNVETGWNTSWWIDEKTTTGFRLNFNVNPATANSYVNVRVIPRG